MSADLEIGLLRTFLAIVDTGGLTAAGKKVGRTQPAITHQIGRLENRLGRALFASDRRHIALAADGEILLEYARAIIRLNNETYDLLSSRHVTGEVTLGTPDLYAAYILPEVLGSFARAHPNIEIQLRCTRSIHLHEALARGELDIALMTNQPDFKRGELIREEPIAWVSGLTSSIERQDPLPLALLPKGSVYRHRALQALRVQGRSWSIRSVCDSIAGLQATVLAGLAVSVFPSCALTGNVRRLDGTDGLPSLSPVELVLHPRPGGVSQAADYLAQYIGRELATGSG